MNRSFAFAAMLLVGCAVGATARGVVAPARAEGQGGPTYEYDTKTLKNAGSAEERALLHTYGQQGWRLVTVMSTASELTTFYFERTLPSR